MPNDLNGKEPNWFLVTSIGRTATYWLSWSLNRHPDILCSHGRHFPPAIYSLHGDNGASVGLSEIGEPIRSIYDIPDTEASGLDDQAVHQSREAFNGATVGVFLDAHRRYGDSSLIGNVHGYVLGELIFRLQAKEAGRSFTLVNLVRNPIGQILSFNRRHLFDAQRDETYKESRIRLLQRQPDLIASVCDRFGVDLSDLESAIYLSTVIDVAKMQQDICIDTALHVPYELLTTSQDAFQKLLSVIAGGADIVADKAYLDEVFSQGPMNYSSKRETPVEDAFAALEDWQKFAIGECLTEDVVSKYGALGYDLGFFSDSPGAADR